MSLLDIFIVGTLIMSVIFSFFRGFVRESLSLATWIIALVVAINFYSEGAIFLSAYIEQPALRMMLSFAGIFIGILVVGTLLSSLFSKLIKHTGLSGTDRLVGAVFGILRGILIIGVLSLSLQLGHFDEMPQVKNSQLLPYFQGVADWLNQFVPDFANKFMSES